MATLGRGKVKKTLPRPLDVPVTIGAPAVNLIAAPIKVELVTRVALQPSFLTSPIMGEDFITGTGFKPSKTILG